MKDDQPTADNVHRSVDGCHNGGGPRNETGQIACGSLLTLAMVTENCVCHLLATRQTNHFCYAAYSH